MNVFKLEFLSRWKGLVLWSGIVSGLLVLFMAFYPSMKSDMMQQLVGVGMEGFPPAMLEVLGLNSFADLSDINFYFCYVAQYLLLAAGVYAALLGSSALIREESDGTIEYLYAQPVSRAAIVFQKMLACFAAYLLYVLAQLLVSSALYAAFRPEGSDFSALLGNLGKVYAGMLFVGAVFLALGFAASAVLRSAGQSAPLSLGLVFGTYLLGIFSVAVKQLEFLKWVSPVTLFQPEKLVRDGFRAEAVWIFAAVAAVSFASAFLLYRRKDLKA